MVGKILLRVASALMFLHDVGHTLGHLGWKHSSDAAKQVVIKAMTESQFPFMGSSRSLGDYYDGYGYAATVTLLLVSVLLWLVSSADLRDNSLARRILITLCAFLLAWVIIEVLYFFLFAAAFSFLALVLTVVALGLAIRAKR